MNKEETPPALSNRVFSRLAVQVLIKTILLLLAGALLWNRLFFFHYVRGQMMYPGIRDGDLLLLTRVVDTYHIGDVVLARAGEKTILARIEAMETDVVDLDEEGRLWINETMWEEDVFYPTFPAEGKMTFPHTVEKDSLFLLCDHRTDTGDSRTYGTVKQENMEGKVIAVLRRRGF